jgi:DHA1 family tetracycline resistance protein-like MFS transporter
LNTSIPESHAPRLRWLIFSIVVIDAVGFGIVIPILPFLSPALGGDAQDVALIMVAYSVAAGVVGPFWGRLSDRIGRRNVLVLCLAGAAMAYIQMAHATELWQVYLARLLAGFFAGNFPVATALMADVSTTAQRARAMGLVGAAFGVGLVLGPLFGGVLSGDDGAWAMPCYFAAVTSMLAGLLSGILLPRHRLRDDTASEPPKRLGFVAMMRRDRSGWLILQFAVHTTAVTSAIYLLPLWSASLLGWGPQEVGLFFGVVGVAMIVFQGGLVHWLTRRFGLLPVLRAGATVFATSAVIAAGVESFWGVVILGLMAFTGSTVALPVLNTMASQIVSTAERGSMMGMTASAGALGRVLGPLISSGALALAGFPGAWVALALILSALLSWSFLDGRRYGESGS